MVEARAHVVVVGAGIVGLSCAYHLCRAGSRVTIIDYAQDDGSASHGNAGAVAVAEILPLPEPGILRRLPGYIFNPLGPLSIRLRYLPWLMPYLRYFLAAANFKIQLSILIRSSSLAGLLYSMFRFLTIN